MATFVHLLNKDISTNYSSHVPIRSKYRQRNQWTIVKHERNKDSTLWFELRSMKKKGVEARFLQQCKDIAIGRLCYKETKATIPRKVDFSSRMRVNPYLKVSMYRKERETYTADMEKKDRL